MGKKFTKCPKCGGEDLQYWGFDDNNDDIGGVYETVECACGYSWNEVYRFAFSEDMDGMEIK